MWFNFSFVIFTTKSAIFVKTDINYTNEKINFYNGNYDRRYVVWAE